MALWTWWPGDHLPSLRLVNGFDVDHRGTVDDLTAPENRASARGIEKAGFTPVAQLAFTQERRAGLAALRSREERAGAGGAVLGLPVLEPTREEPVSPCWCCVLEALRQSSTASCWRLSSSQTQHCSC